MRIGDGLTRYIDSDLNVVVRDEQGVEYVQSLDNDGSYVPVSEYQRPAA